MQGGRAASGRQQALRSGPGRRSAGRAGAQGGLVAPGGAEVVARFGRPQMPGGLGKAPGQVGAGPGEAGP